MKTLQQIEQSLEAEMRMMCSYYFHKEMAMTAQRAKEMEGLWLESVKRVKFISSQAILSALEDARGTVEIEKKDERDARKLGAWDLAIGYNEAIAETARKWSDYLEGIKK